MPRTVPIPFRLAYSLRSSININPLLRRQFASSQTPPTTTTPASTERDHDVTSPKTKTAAEESNTGTTTTKQSRQDLTEKQKKTMAQMDEELRLKMSGMAGDGGEAGVEYEDGKPVAMKRSVKNNMFRYI